MYKSKWFVGSAVLAGCLAIVGRVSTVSAAGNDAQIAKQLTTDKITLTRAIEVAQEASKGKAVSASARMMGSDLEIYVHCLAGDRCMEVPVNAKTGKAGKLTETKAIGKLNPLAQAREVEKLLTEDKITLASAIQTAQTNSKGEAISAHCTTAGAKLTIEVRCVAAEKPLQVLVDGKTNKVTRTEQVAQAGGHPRHHGGNHSNPPKK
ncbi:MAG: hypothetical protein HS101_11895 [Planctomycetia bacterium]|jgi:uncharacterized membrane protein YkoI|nr:hypothetical protein [Planctomycetia bacterium]MCC7316114.1 hypothetical protein [Planctomycetota bacterium]OQZ01534.1 MAG: hypothetical protein B6D36_14125 [Planctomycetes bacterium UTPLA1]